MHIIDLISNSSDALALTCVSEKFLCPASAGTLTVCTTHQCNQIVM